MLMIKNPPDNAGDAGIRFDPWVRKIPWRRKWQPSPGFLPGELLGDRSPVGYSPWGCKELDMTEHTLHSTELIYNIVLVSGVKQSDSIIYTFFFFSDSFFLALLCCVWDLSSLTRD